MKIVWNTVAVLALSGVFTFALADADPKLQALLDQRGNQLSADAERLKELEAQREERNRLENSIGETGNSGRIAAGELEAKAQEFQRQARELSDDIRAAANNLDSLTTRQLRLLGERQDVLIEIGGELSDAAAEAVKNGVRGENFAGSVFFLQAVVLIRTNLVAQIDNFDGKPLETDNEILGPLKDRLNKLADEVDDIAERGKEFDTGVKAEDFERLEDLRANADDRKQEFDDIKERAERQGSGAGVLVAFGDRLSGDSDNVTSDLAGNAEAGDRVQELAEGLQNAGARLSEIQNEVDELDGKLDDLEDRIVDAERESVLLRAQLLSKDLLRESKTVAEQLLRDAQARLDKLRSDGANDRDIRVAERELEQRQNFVDAINGGLAADETRTNEEIAFLKAQVAKALEEENRLLAERKRLNDQKDALLDERFAIAALQGELEDLIRNGAPLGDPAGTADGTSPSASLDSFLNGGNPEGAVETASTDGPDPFEELANNDPLGLDQFGFDADQGATEDITGFNANGGLNLIPCPPGSNALPVGTLVSDTALCFT